MKGKKIEVLLFDPELQGARVDRDVASGFGECKSAGHGLGAVVPEMERFFLVGRKRGLERHQDVADVPGLPVLVEYADLRRDRGARGVGDSEKRDIAVGPGGQGYGERDRVVVGGIIGGFLDMKGEIQSGYAEAEKGKQCNGTEHKTPF